ncbi:MAG: DNA alkylation repair protein [Roseburia sp.]|nr:DNA alkylation repair protein [Roseburia sp.]
MNNLQLIKQRFFAMRNGIIADTLRRSGTPYRMIFGLNLPQIKEIAADFAPNLELARQLRDDRATRESQMIAPMLMTADYLTVDEATEWLLSAPTVEAIDILCHSLLRHHQAVSEIIDRALTADSDMAHYGAVRLMWNVFRSNHSHYRSLAEKELASNRTATASLTQNLLDEINFLYPTE